MAKQREFYKGKRKRRNYALIPFAVLLGLVALIVVLFYGMQKYAVITKDSVSVILPSMEQQETTVDAQGNEIKVFDPVDTEIVFDAPDYSVVEASAGRNLSGMRAIYVPTADITTEKIDEYTSRLSTGNALMLEMKPRSGILMWDSDAQLARMYGLYVPSQQSEQLPAIMEKLKEKEVYTVARISCCIDELLTSRCTTMALRTELGYNYSDDTGVWLDPYNPALRAYIADLVRELYAMGFDEVVLADFAHPVLEEDVKVVYTQDMSTPPGPVNAICGFAVSLVNELSDRDGVLSVLCNTPPALVRADTTTGQDCTLFAKVFDRIYYETDKYAYPYNISDIERSITVGRAVDRFVPIVINYLPDDPGTCSWVLIDMPEEDD